MYKRAIELLIMIRAILSGWPGSKGNKDYAGQKRCLSSAVDISPNDLNSRKHLVAIMALNLVLKPSGGNTFIMNSNENFRATYDIPVNRSQLISLLILQKGSRISLHSSSDNRLAQYYPVIWNSPISCESLILRRINPSTAILEKICLLDPNISGAKIALFTQTPREARFDNGDI